MNNKITSFILSIALIFSSSLHASNILDENNICQASGDTIFAILQWCYDYS
ncbi:hypothetical protein SAMN05444586_102011 [Acinetobacter bohemicus]|uniref:Uncharacterized protein n=1 Tax=Acinetobacter bohemicus TaxID=1435036 RepID=A0A1I6V174_9GAMM|nr:hypothetical protein SAMN05444586_102011 [Acinetobacter bohemicus]